MNALRRLPLLLILAACTNPGLHAGIGIGPGGISIKPVVSAKVAGANVSISP